MAEFQIIDHRPRQPGGGEPKHFATVLTASRRAVGLVGRNRAGQEADFIESQRVACQPGQMEMPEVDRIEGAAEEADFARGCHGFRSELYRRGET